MGQFTALHFLKQKQNRCTAIAMAKYFIDNKAPRAENLSARVAGQLPSKMRSSSAAWQDVSHTVGMFIRTIQQRPRASAAAATVFRPSVCAAISLHGIFAASLAQKLSPERKLSGEEELMLSDSEQEWRN